jgi:hypothetical protein
MNKDRQLLFHRYQIILAGLFAMWLSGPSVAWGAVVIPGCNSTLGHCLFDKDSATVTGAVAQTLRAGTTFLGILITIMILIGAYYWFTSGGDPNRFKKGKEYVMAGLTGAALFMLFYAILRLVGVNI